ncbi:MAG: Methyltransferase type 12 [Acidimicrobiales bacterium]|nr:Methyltransferase type 12 [Acidimicrobiales bacterium]
MITHDRIPEYYDWLSRYVQVANWLSYRNRFASFTMHKRLTAPGDARPRAGLEYVNERLLDVAAPAPDARVLDAGCGFGGTVFHWQARAGGRYEGLTLSRVQLDVARREARRRGVEDLCRFHLRSYDEPLVPEYDVVVAIESLIHSRDLMWTVPNLARGLRPGGVLVVLDDMAVADLDRARPVEAALLRDHWGCARYPTDADYRHAVALSGLTMAHDEDLSPLMRPRPPDVLDGMQRRFSVLHRAIPVPPVRTVVSAYLGGIALERLHGSGDVRYRLLVARNDEDGG